MDKIEMLHELCGALFEQLQPIADKISKGGMSNGDLEAVDKITHAIKSIKTTVAMMEADDGYSEAYMPRYGTYHDPRNGMSYRDGRSYARRRDSMGRYSKDGYSYDTEELRDMLRDLPEHERRKIIDEMR